MTEPTTAEARDDLLDTARQHLATAGLDIVHLPADAGFEVRLSHPLTSQMYDVQVKNRLTPASAHVVRAPADHRLLLVAPFVSDTVGELLRSRDVHYVDAAGNMYLRWDGVLIDVRGRRNPAIPTPTEPGRALRSFKPSGLKIVFALLCEPDTAATPYRDIARATGTSLGTVHWVLNELDAAGYVSGGRDRRLHRTGELFNRWVEAYTLDLYPRLILARFDAPDPTWWTRADDAVREAGALWGAETAAYQLNPHLRPARAVIYAWSVPQRLAVDHRFRKADGVGNVEVRQRFWQGGQEPGGLTVPTPLVYADLVAAADPRLIEAAADLRQHDALLRRLDLG